MKGKVFTIELGSSYPEWWRYNVYVSVAEYDSEGVRTGYRNAVDRVYEIEEGAGEAARQAPAGWTSGSRRVSVVTEPCDHIAIYVYAIANTFPGSALIRDSPPFEAELTVREGSREVLRKTYEVNQWGGLTIAGLRVGEPEPA